ncbi:hypothetical protein SAMN05216532_0132 [Streptomyces sp. 2231.1]|nr:hypothetical protein SAMN05216532_0132 [Streptomyces sp. 2231.1]
MNIKEGEKKPFPVNDMFVFDQVVPVNRTITLSVHMWDLDFSASDITQAQMDLFGAALQGAGNAAAAYFGDAKAVQAADAFLRAVADKVPLATAQYAEQLDQRDELANIRQQFNVAKLQPGLYNWRVTDDGNNRNIMDIDGPQKTERNVAARSNLLYGLSNFDYTIWYRVQVTNA